jgi:hypothetical protein
VPVSAEGPDGGAHVGGASAGRNTPRRWGAPRPSRVVALAAVVAAAVAIVVSVGGNGAPANLDPVAQAADSTLRAGGAHYALSMTMTIPNVGPITMRGKGYMNAANREGEMSLHTTSVPASVAAKSPGGAVTIDMVFKGYTYYMHLPFLAGRMPAGKTWMKLNVASLVKQQYGFSPGDFQNGTTDPGQFLKMLKASHATVVRQAVLHGVQTTEYRGTIDLHSVVDQLPDSERAQAKAGIDKLIAQVGTSTLPVEAWVDSSHHLRRMHMSVPITTLGSTGGVDMTMDMSDFGSVQPVVIPPDSQVYDATGLVGSTTGGG